MEFPGAEITIGKFTAYDEYGAGVQAGAEIVAREALDFDGLSARVLGFHEIDAGG